MSANGNWKRELSDIIHAHNSRHARGHKGVSFATMTERRQSLFRCFRTLRALGYQLAPPNLRTTHIEVLVRYWTADPAVAALPACRNGRCKPLAAPHSASHIQKQLSFLRVYAEWIGKPGMVQTARKYVDEPAMVARQVATSRDKSWTGNAIETAELVAKIDAADPFVGAQVELMLAFGLRRKEAVMFKPRVAEVPLHAMPVGLQLDPATTWLSFLKIRNGTKGGRLRFTAVRSEQQKRALEKACRLAQHEDSHMGRPGHSLKQALDHFSYVLRSHGCTGKDLGVTGHGLRHQFAADLYFELTEVAPPVKGGMLSVDRDVMRAAYLEVARQLGHNRRAITGAYLGAPGGSSAASARPDEVEPRGRPRAN